MSELLLLGAGSARSGRVWTPQNVFGQGVTGAWLRPEELPAAGDTIPTEATWNIGKNGYLCYVYQTTPASRPVVVDNAYGNFRGIDHDGIDDYIFTQTAASIEGTLGFTAAWVWSWTGTPAGSSAGMFQSSGGLYFGLYRSNGSIQWRNDASVPASAYTGATVSRTAGWYAMVVEVTITPGSPNTAVLTGTINGAQVASPIIFTSYVARTSYTNQFYTPGRDKLVEGVLIREPGHIDNLNAYLQSRYPSVEGGWS